jgi:hypothetical protein
VHFNTGCNTSPPSIIQSKPNTPVVLPQWQDTLSWYFLGWSETEIADNKIRTPIFQAGETYMPCRNTNLWAVYSDVKEDVVVTDYSTGVYTITRCNDFTHEISNSGVALAGNIHGEELQLADVQMKMNRDSIYCLESEILADMLYELVFNDDSTVYITHSITSEPIGYKETKLRDIHTLWKYRVLSDGSIVFYTSFKGKDYAINFIINANGVPVAILRNTDLNKWNNNKNIPLYSFPLKYKKNPLLLSPYLLITNHLYYNRITNFKQPINIGYLLKITFQTNKTDGLIYHISMQIMIV